VHLGGPSAGPAAAGKFDHDAPAKPAGGRKRPRRDAGIDKSVLKIGEPRRYRDNAHLKFVALQRASSAGGSPRTRIILGSRNPVP
jgi:hypothetical protein